MSWIKTQWNKFKKWLVLLIIPVAVASTFLGTSTIEAITLENGRVVEFPYTDSLVGETIHIYTDKSHYDQGLKQAEIYFAIVVDKKQDIDFGVLLNEKYTVSEIELLVPQTRTIYTPVYKEECEKTTIISATTSEPVEQEVCTSALVRTDETHEEYYGSESELFIKKEKEIDEKDKYKITENVDKGIHYGKITIPITENVIDEEFWLFAVDEDGAESILDPWFSSSWTYRKKIEIDSSKVGSTETSFPVFIDLSDMGSDFFDNAKADGCDIRIVESDDTTETAFELVSYATTTNTGELHFMADSLSSSATTTFYMYYGNSGASCYASTTTYGSQNVWGGYISVYHLETASTDSTGANNLSDTNTPVYASGKLSGGIDVERDSSQYANKTSVSGLPANNANCTISVWMKIENSVNYMTAVALYGNKYIGTQIDSGNNYLIYNIGANENWEKTSNTLLPSSGTWVHVATVRDGASSSKIYIDGTLKKSFSDSGLTTTPDEINIGKAVGTDYFDGMIDEVLISSTAFSSTWIATEHNNQSSPSTFYDIGTQESDEVVYQSTGANWFE